MSATPTVLVQRVNSLSRAARGSSVGSSRVRQQCWCASLVIIRALSWPLDHSIPWFSSNSSNYDASFVTVHDGRDDNEMAEEGRGSLLCWRRPIANSKPDRISCNFFWMSDNNELGVGQLCDFGRASRNGRCTGKDTGMWSWWFQPRYSSD